MPLCPTAVEWLAPRRRVTLGLRQRGVHSRVKRSQPGCPCTLPGVTPELPGMLRRALPPGRCPRCLTGLGGVCCPGRRALAGVLAASRVAMLAVSSHCSETPAPCSGGGAPHRLSLVDSAGPVVAMGLGVDLGTKWGYEPRQWAGAGLHGRVGRLLAQALAGSSLGSLQEQFDIRVLSSPPQQVWKGLRDTCSGPWHGGQTQGRLRPRSALSAGCPDLPPARVAPCLTSSFLQLAGAARVGTAQMGSLAQGRGVNPGDGATG